MVASQLFLINDPRLELVLPDQATFLRYVEVHSLGSGHLDPPCLDLLVNVRHHIMLQGRGGEGHRDDARDEGRRSDPTPDHEA